MPAAAATSQRSTPERDAAFAHLDLPALRHYRSVLTAEEGRVSYWRRIIQARLDLVQASTDGNTPEVNRLRGLFAEGRLPTSRTALVEVLPVDDMPPLPDLAQLWARSVESLTRTGRQALIRDLIKAERQLSAYRSALHRRLAAATGELIARYHDEPALCLSVLPLDRQASRRAAG